MKTLIQNFITFFLILAFSFNLLAQEIQIDLTFTGDTLILPFEGIDKISELSMEGSATLNQDTSLVRVILEDEFGFQYMVFETYPLICTNQLISIKEYCDETCALDQIKPVSLIIQLIDAALTIDSLIYSDQEKQDAELLRYEAKRDKDAKKIETMNQQIGYYGMNWTAGDNEEIAMYYDQKRQLYGDEYNLLGYDYYAGGVFEFLGHRVYPKVNPDLVRSFDWRNRHGANSPLSPYWDGDNLGTGWFSSVKMQGTCGGCWAFSAVGAVEAITNLYSVDSLDFDLSEQYLISCCPNAGNCKDGGYPDIALEYMQTEIVTEYCIPYYQKDTACVSVMCQNPDSILNIQGCFPISKDFDSIRINLIKHGPLTFGFKVGMSKPHAVVLSGFKFDPVDSTLTWIYKDSKPGDPLNQGFKEIKLETIHDTCYAVEPPIYVLVDTTFYNYDTIPQHCYDKDLDGYYFWGIGPKPDTLGSQEIGDCDDNNPFVGGYDENYNCRCNIVFDTVGIHIASDTTWSDTTYVNNEVIIDSGACLTISSYAAFVPEAGIRVKQGGKLILDSAYLTKICPELWQGIDVLGSDTIQVLDEYFGKVVVRNNSIIEYAEVGIANHCRTCNYQDIQCGGIILAENSIFRDNERDILLNPFSTFWFNHDLPYSCIISDCQFITTDNFYPNHSPIAHIEMKDIYGVMIYGSNFENQSDYNTYHFPIRGSGISSIDSYFMINRYCTTPNTIPCETFDTCEFKQLEYGIKALNCTSFRTLNIKEVIFEDNLVGISLSGIDNASIISNIIKSPSSAVDIPENRFIGGLFMEGCNGYHVENNYFYQYRYQGFSGEDVNKFIYGIGVKNSGPDNNEIYNNRFDTLYAGIKSIGENRGRDTSGLCLKCNDMVENANDFMVVEDDGQPTGIQGIHLFQGNPDDTISITAPAGNTFSNPHGKNADYEKIENFNYFNSVEDIFYLHHISAFDIVVPFDSNYTHETIELIPLNIQYNKSQACPSGLGGGHLKSYSSPRENIINADNHIALLKTQLTSLVDGGNTEELNFKVMTSFPEDGLELRQELLGESPYLSDTVLKQAIYKEDVLPNAMIRDIMEANPQSAKKDDLLEALGERSEPMPDYMMAQVMEGKNYFGARELFEAEIQLWQQFRSKAKYDLMRQFLLDTNMVNPMDSVIAFFETENDLKSKYDLAFAYWEKQDSVNAMLTINNIPSLFTLNDIQSTVHQQYDIYFGILEQIAENHWQTCNLDSSSVQELFGLLEFAGDAGIKAHARGLLVKGGFINYMETVPLTDYTKSSGPNYNPESKSIHMSHKDYLRIFPNPAGDYVIVYYNLESKSPTGLIAIYDIKGNLICKYDINPIENQIVIDIKELPNGIYIIGLHANDRLVESEKLSKGRF
jgi:hypothetical protein